MTEFHDDRQTRQTKQTMERLHQHLARADVELRDAQHVLNAGGAAEEAEMDLVHDDVAAATLAVTSALERVRSRLGVPSPSEAKEQPGRVEPQPAVQSTQAQESPEMAMPEAGGGPLPRDQQRASEAPRRWWQFWR
jgi:hypothetical protein